jgi:hypothetical protein
MNVQAFNAFDTNNPAMDARKAAIFAAIPRDRELAEIERFIRERGASKCPLGASGLEAEFEAIDHDFERSREVFAAHLAEGARLEYGR